MNDHARPFEIEFHGDASLGALLAALAPYGDKALLIDYDGRAIRSGYHVTEVKAGSFVTLDCGGNPDSWKETILQVEDLAPDDGQTFMTVGKFRGILAKVASQVTIDPDARLTLEVGPPETAMRIYDVGRVQIVPEGVQLVLAARPAICKPRHRQAASAPAQATSCCAGPATKTKCC